MSPSPGATSTSRSNRESMQRGMAHAVVYVLDPDGCTVHTVLRTSVPTDSYSYHIIDQQPIQWASAITWGLQAQKGLRCVPPTRRNVIKYSVQYQTFFADGPICPARMSPLLPCGWTAAHPPLIRRSSAAHPPLRHASPKNFALALDLRALRGHDWGDIYIPVPGFGSRKWLK
jgi:hypothetical protein